jgi:hypothetical protein
VDLCKVDSSGAVALVTVDDKDLGTVYHSICYFENNSNVIRLDTPEYDAYEVSWSYSKFESKELYYILKHDYYSIDLHHIGSYIYSLQRLLYRPTT